MYLFGRVIPALSLVLSMTLRFVPLFRRQLEVVRQAQFCIGRDASCGSVWQRVRRAVTIFSIMVTWALENAIETADSMKSRGYGLRQPDSVQDSVPRCARHAVSLREQTQPPDKHARMCQWQ